MLDSHFKGYSLIPQETVVWIPAGTSRLIKETGISSSELCKIKHYLIPKVSGLLQCKLLCLWNEWWHWSPLQAVPGEAGLSLSGLLCLVTCFGFFALKFLNSLPFFSSSCYFQMNSISFWPWSPFIAVVVSEKYVVWYIPMWKWIHFIVVLICHSILPPF